MRSEINACITTFESIVTRYSGNLVGACLLKQNAPGAFKPVWLLDPRFEPITPGTVAELFKDASDLLNGSLLRSETPAARSWSVTRSSLPTPHALAVHESVLRCRRTELGPRTAPDRTVSRGGDSMKRTRVLQGLGTSLLLAGCAGGGTPLSSVARLPQANQKKTIVNLRRAVMVGESFPKTQPSGFAPAKHHSEYKPRRRYGASTTRSASVDTQCGVDGCPTPGGGGYSGPPPDAVSSEPGW